LDPLCRTVREAHDEIIGSDRFEVIKIEINQGRIGFGPDGYDPVIAIERGLPHTIGSSASEAHTCDRA